MENWLKDKTIVITGASSGFGKLLTEKTITRYNCKVIGIGRNEEKLKGLKERFGDKFLYFTFDVGNENNWRDFAQKIPIIDLYPDILINNAGVLPSFARFELTPDGEPERVFKTNFFASVYSVRHLLPIIKKHSKSPAVINISSSAILANVVGTSIYTSTKCALASFTKILALENKNLYVGLICPGFSGTGIFREQKHMDTNSSSIIGKNCSSPDKLTDYMLKKIIKKKKMIIPGTDAKAMHVFGNLFPNFTDKFICKVLKKSKLTVFEDVFCE